MKDDLKDILKLSEINKEIKTRIFLKGKKIPPKLHALSDLKFN